MSDCVTLKFQMHLHLANGDDCAGGGDDAKAGTNANPPEFRLKAEGEISGVGSLMGPSGAGKSTLLRAIAGLPLPALRLTQPATMNITLGNTRLAGNGYNLTPETRHIGMVFQDSRLFPHLSVAGNLNFASKRANGRIHHEPERIINGTGIAPLLGRRPDSLSGGERQRVALARTLCYQPQLLLLDEPLSALDRNGRAALLRYLDSYLVDAAIPALMVSHDLYDATQIARHLMYMEHGEIIAQGSPEAISARLDLDLAAQSDATAVLQAQVLDYDHKYSIIKVAIGTSYVQILGPAKTIGSKVRIFIAAQDVALSLAFAPNNSILNQIPVSLDQIIKEDGGTALIRLNLNDGQQMLARISRLSLNKLNIKPTAKIYALIKSVALSIQ